MATCRWVIWVVFAPFIFAGCADNSKPQEQAAAPQRKSAGFRGP